MPKVSFAVKKPEETVNKSIKAIIAYKQLQKGLSAEDLAFASRMKKGTLYYRLRNPETFRLCELRAIAKKLDVDLESLVTGKMKEEPSKVEK